ncbi:hypothetical protein EXE43_17430 [Halorubrum sp. SS5]|uniref:hypothetical protein n=1 Tax=Halorubrum sp. SS7 TaxID=2518119 RepID=UPI0010F97E49|nr:hypothetical protein [Halorubrum sp. SS7]TKX55654.1 hypothetical protein EXE44_16170 [Halorubrum sp. SS7]TKX84710.1 hypothetical protein EXE43_17430 [Halorubrum sp. SS5]
MPEENEFSYSGYLIFNSVLEFEDDSNIYSDDSVTTVESEIHDDLPEFEPGSFSQPGDGFELLSIRDYIRDDEEVDEELEAIADDLLGIRYQHEDFIEQEAEVDGERRIVHIPTINSVDAYWVHPEFIALRGQKGEMESAKERLQRVLSTGVLLREIQFDADFLLWLFYKYRTGDDLTSGLGIRKLTDSEAKGREDYFGRSNIVSDSQNLGQSTPLLIGILRQKSVSMLEGFFTMDGVQIAAKIEKTKIHVKASKGAISETTNDTLRVALAIRFVRELVELYEHWESLDPVDKYPPFEFFEGIYEECINQGVRIDTIPDTLLRRFANLRDEPPSEWNVGI